MSAKKLKRSKTCQVSQSTQENHGPKDLSMLWRQRVSAYQGRYLQSFLHEMQFKIQFHFTPTRNRD